MGIKNDPTYSVRKPTGRFWQLWVRHNFKSLQVVFLRIWESGAVGKGTVGQEWDGECLGTQPAMPHDLQIMYFPTETWMTAVGTL